MEKIYRVPSKYQPRFFVERGIWLRVLLPTIPLLVVMLIIAPYIPDRLEPWFSVVISSGWIFLTVALPVFIDMICWDRNVGRADSGTYWIIGDDTLTVVDKETNKPSQIIHRSEIFGIVADAKELTIVTNKGEIVLIPRVVVEFDELYDLLNTWKAIESRTYRLSNRTSKQRLGSWIGICVFVLVPVSAIANLLTTKLLPTIIFSSITLISSSFLVTGSFIVNRLTGKGDFWEGSLEFILIALVTLAKLALVIYVS